MRELFTLVLIPVLVVVIGLIVEYWIIQPLRSSPPSLPQMDGSYYVRNLWTFILEKRKYILIFSTLFSVVFVVIVLIIRNLNFDKHDIMHEMQAKGLLQKLYDAQDYSKGGSLNGDQSAVRLYREVIHQLSPNARKKLNQQLQEEAEENEKGGRMDLAVRRYEALFADYLRRE